VARNEPFAGPTPLGLIGLAVGCAALTPVALGFRLTPAGLKTAAVMCLLFGAGCQLLAGLTGFANKNLCGATLFTAFAFIWTLNWWVLGALSLWIAFALLVHPTAGRVVFPIAGPVFRAQARPGFDPSRRRAIFAAPYRHWQANGFRPLPIAELESAVAPHAAGRAAGPQLEYLAELGGLVAAHPGESAPAAVRPSPAGIGFFEQVVLRKDRFA